MECAHILVVEDEWIVAKDLAQHLQRMGHSVAAVVASGEEAVRTVAAIRPHLVLMDIRLQGRMDGVEAATAIRAAYDVPIVYLTAHADEATLQRAKVTEPFGYILKPFEERELQISIEMALYKHRMEQKLREREQWLSTTLTSIGEAVITTDVHHSLTFMNPVAETLTGWRSEEALGRDVRKVYLVKDETTQQSLENPVVIALREDRMVALRDHALLITKTGGAVPVADNAAPIRDQRLGVCGSVLVFRDVSVQKQLEEALRAEVEVAASLARVGGELIAGLDSSTLMARLCQLTAEVLDSVCSYTLLWRPHDLAFAPVAGWGDTPEEWEALRALMLPHASFTTASQLFEGVDFVECASSSLYGALVALLQRRGVSWLLVFALRRGKELRGLQVVGYQKQSASVGETKRRIAQGIAQMATLALENADLLEQTEMANRLKTDFLATMSHELRTPLNIILGYTDLLLEGEFGLLSTDQQAPLQKIDKNARELLELIIATLDISRLEVGQAAPQISAVELQMLIDELQGEIPQLVEKPLLHLAWRVEQGTPTLWTDRFKLKVILKNLLANAVKFTDTGGVQLSVRPRGEGVEFNVEDTGVGIKPEALSVIFEPFWQGESPKASQHKGVGLGLYIVKKLVTILGGTITVESALGKGSIFSVWLPYQAAAPQRQ